MTIVLAEMDMNAVGGVFGMPGHHIDNRLGRRRCSGS